MEHQHCDDIIDVYFYDAYLNNGIRKVSLASLFASCYKGVTTAHAVLVRAKISHGIKLVGFGGKNDTIRININVRAGSLGRLGDCGRCKSMKYVLLWTLLTINPH